VISKSKRFFMILCVIGFEIIRILNHTKLNPLKPSKNNLLPSVMSPNYLIYR
jgi:hypothetical protein